MKKVILTVAALGVALLLTQDADAGILGRRCRPTYVRQAPVAVAPALVTAEAGDGYRVFNYEPAPDAVVRFQAPVRRATGGGHAYINATNKAFGRVN